MDVGWTDVPIRHIDRMQTWEEESYKEDKDKETEEKGKEARFIKKQRERERETIRSGEREWKRDREG